MKRRVRHAALVVVLAVGATGGVLSPVAASPAGAPAGSSRVAPYDFNGDGYAELVIASADGVNAGAINVLTGGQRGLSAAGDDYWSQNRPGVRGISELNDRFGWSTASADFNGDGYADLAVGVPSERINGVRNGGAVNVLYGTARGLSARNDQLWSQLGAVPGAHERDDAFGTTLAAGDFDGDGFAELAVGVPYERIGAIEDAGSVVVLIGTRRGLSAVGSTVLSQGTSGVADEPTQGEGGPPQGDHFGAELAVGDVDGDRHADLAIGVPGEWVDGVPAQGAIHLLRGSRKGLATVGSEFWTQASEGVPDVGTNSFGAAMVFGDFNGAGRDDLAVSGDVGVAVLYGDRSGLTTHGSRLLAAAGVGMPRAAGNRPYVLKAEAAGDLGGSPADDLALYGQASLDCCRHVDGVVTLFGGRAGLSISGSRVWTQNTAGVPGHVEPDDGDRGTAAVANFGRSNGADLAISFPGEDGRGLEQSDVGIVFALYSGATSLTATGIETWSQGVAGVSGRRKSGDQFGLSLGS